MKKILLTILFISVIQFVNAADKYSRAKIWFDGKQPALIAALGIDLTEGEFRNDIWFVSDFSTDELRRIKDGGFRTEILIDDVSKYYRDRNNNNRKTRASADDCSSQPEYPVPSHFHLGSMGGFFTYNEMLDILDSMRLLYPSLISDKQPIDSITSLEGRPIYYLRISDNPDVDENEPEVLYDAVHHAREPESLSQLIYYMWYLLENYATDTTVKALVDNTQMYFVPCVNPDGYLYNETTDPNGGGMWRKNRRNNLDGTFGVDINRNYGYQWGYDTLGSSIIPSRENYRGTSPFSEPETQAMRDFLNSRHFQLALNYHTYGDHLIIPWGYIPNLLTPDSIQFDYYGHEISRYNRYQFGTTNQTLNYLVNGAADDWFYGEQTTKQKIFSFTPEVGTNDDGFWPASNRIVDLSQENMYADFTLAKLAGKYGKLNHQTPEYIDQLNNEFVFNFIGLGLDTTGNFTITLVPVSTNIASSGSAITISNPGLIHSVTDSISFTLSPSILPADEILFAITVNNGLYTEADTIKMKYGTPVSILLDSASDMSNWNNTGSMWNTTFEDYVSAPTSITDSPFNNYMPNENSSMISNNPVSLSGALDARLTFFTKWNTERHYDYVQVLASADNGINWTPLCGKYTSPGKLMQNLGQPEYDGKKLQWVQEEMSLNDYLNESVLLKFQLITDNFQEFDGFYFDDLNIEIIQNNIGITGDPDQLILNPPFPNPSSTISNVEYKKTKQGSTLIVLDAMGRITWQTNLKNENGTIQIPVSQFAPGIYTGMIKQADGSFSSPVKLCVQK